MEDLSVVLYELGRLREKLELSKGSNVDRHFEYIEELLKEYMAKSNEFQKDHSKCYYCGEETKGHSKELELSEIISVCPRCF